MYNYPSYLFKKAKNSFNSNKGTGTEWAKIELVFNGGNTDAPLCYTGAVPHNMCGCVACYTQGF